MKTFHAALGFVAAFVVLATPAQPTTGPAAHRAPAASAAAAPASDGEVLKVDKAQGKLTLKHGPLANLDMPGMTMVFRVANPGMLESVKAGDKVKFTADRVNGAFTVTAIEIAR
ncbi:MULTISPECIES: copper-binding protein [Roseateles]|uniref:Cu/Ag efflux protein CusF n=1 Tax=Pelomonas aquatica TaxID=431058 RepID=A0ABU1Z6E3_9BURK|nr:MULTISPECIES: copper-binding protein [Roseateles]KQY89364.1 RND transporter [Pelomonas sp. Root1444]MDR7295311.1 Cu/Ag efflux protein CusF [Pelomonas aquatica]